MITLDFENRTDFSVDSFLLSEIERVAEVALELESFPISAEISLILVDNQEISCLNKRFRHIDSPTDVLSFPSYSLSPGSYCGLSGEIEPVVLGDIVISIDKAISQSEEYGHSLLRELAFLTVHSLLHLLGYDHLTEDSQMFRRQEEILMKANIHR